MLCSRWRGESYDKKLLFQKDLCCFSEKHSYDLKNVSSS